MGALSISLLCLQLLFVFQTQSDAAALPTKKEAVDYFTNFGYLRTFSDSLNPKLLANSIRGFQRNANLPVTGVFDKATLEQMQKPRCGRGDRLDAVGEFKLQGGRWKKRLLTWRVENGGTKVSFQETREIFRKAAAIWAKYTNMDFKEITQGTADIMIKYGRYEHGDFYYFDGRGGTLAHAFYPYEGSEIGGDVHYDDDEDFVIGPQKTGTDINWVTIHELGHSLGLEHSYSKEAIMYPWLIKSDTPNYDLNADDIAGIRALYGMRTTVLTEPPVTTPSTTKPPTTLPPTTLPPTTLPPTTVAPTTKRISKGCVGGVTAILQVRGASWLLVFSGSTFSLGNKDGFLKSRGLKAKSYFPLISGDITAGFLDENSGVTYMFVPRGFYQYRGFSQTQRFQSLQTMGLPSWVDRIDAAFVWKKNKKAYLFSGPRYFRFNLNTQKMDYGYPRYISSAWKGLPNDLSAAATGLDDITYFVKGDKYYVLNDWTVSVKNNYPRAVGDQWLTCSSFGALAGGLSLRPGPDSQQEAEGAEP